MAIGRERERERARGDLAVSPKFSRQQRPHTLMHPMRGHNNRIWWGNHVRRTSFFSFKTLLDVFLSFNQHFSHCKRLTLHCPKCRSMFGQLVASFPPAEFGVQCCFDRRHFLSSLSLSLSAEKLFQRRRRQKIASDVGRRRLLFSPRVSHHTEIAKSTTY